MSDPSTASNAILYSGLVGFFLPLAIAVVIQQSWPSNAKAATAFGCCLLASIGTAYFGGLLDYTDVARCFLVVFTLAVSSYIGLWKPSGVAPTIERVTSIVRS